jgi:LysM repeat protein
MRSRTPARWLAPLALLFAAGAVWLTVNGTVGISADGEDKTKSTTTEKRPEGDSARTETSTTTTTAKKTPKTYRVKPGDTFAAIAVETGLTVEELQELNPNLDPDSLSVGQSVKLR